ncbi:serine hydrolase [Ekhidna sp.]|uniref:serine hydrolase domain-containing protein n=1 Tax=Ekhidna sp. TaxID=2608089 RepID=UPI0032EAC95E
MKNLIIHLILILFISPLCIAQSGYMYSQPVELGDGWETNHLKSTAFDTTRLYTFFNQIIGEEHNLHSVLLIKNNQLIIDEYFNGYDAKKLHDLRSVNKSIKSILLGIAIEKGIIDDINDPISKYLKSHSPKKNLDERKDEITIRHLITMSAGWDCNDWDKKSKGQEDRVYKKEDWIQYTLDLPVVNAPGKVSNYCSMGVIILAEIISQASGSTIDKFAEEYLFKPLGIENLKWGHTSEKDVIPSGKRLYLTPRDLAKIGQLILNEGSWNGQQIVSANWIKESTTTKTAITSVEYGYLWWNIPFIINGKELISKTATGNGGQYIIVIPEMDIVAVFTGGAYNSQEDKLAFAVMKDILLPTFDDKNTKGNK